MCLVFAKNKIFEFSFCMFVIIFCVCVWLCFCWLHISSVSWLISLFNLLHVVTVVGIVYSYGCDICKVDVFVFGHMFRHIDMHVDKLFLQFYIV